MLKDILEKRHAERNLNFIFYFILTPAGLHSGKSHTQREVDEPETNFV